MKNKFGFILVKPQLGEKIGACNANNDQIVGVIAYQRRLLFGAGLFNDSNPNRHPPRNDNINAL